jgi:succinyl-diaminopimelate desuccinylase
VDSLAIPQDFSVDDNGHMVVKAAGKTAHAAFPEGSDSAAVRLARVMAGAPFLTEKEKACFRFPD